MTNRAGQAKLTAADVAGFAETTGAIGGAVTDRLVPPPERPPGKVLEGDVEEVVPELVRLLREEAKAI